MALNTTTPEASARLVAKNEDVKIDGYDLIRMWPFIDATVADTLSATLAASATVSNPLADNQTYTGTFAIAKVESKEGSSDNDDANQRYVNLIQTLIYLNTVSDVASLVALTPIILQENEIKDALGIETGEEDTIAYLYKNINPANRAAFMALADADLVTNLPGAEWTYVDRKFEQKENNTAEASVIFKKIVWNSWGHNSYAADLTEYDNAGNTGTPNTSNEREIIRKTWLRISESDLATAMSNCRSGTNVAAESGYIITAAGVSDNRDGSITVTQTQKKQVNNRDAGTSTNTQKDTFNPLGWDGGYHDKIETHYEHFTRTGLDSAISSETAPSGYTLDGIKEDIDGDGLYSRIYTYIDATFSNTSGTTPNRVLANTRVFGYENTDPQNTQYGIRATQTVGGDGIPIDTLAEIRDNQIADAGYAITDITAQDNGNGSGSIRKRQIKKRTTTNFFYTTYRPQNGNQEEMITDDWHDLSYADAVLIRADAISNKAAISGSSYGTKGTNHVLRSVDLNPAQGVDSGGNQLFDVVRVTYIPIWNYSVFGTRHDYLNEVIWRHDEVTLYNLSGLPTKYDRIVYRKVFSTAAAAWAYADAGTGGSLITSASTDYYDSLGVAKHMGYVEFLGTDGAGTTSFAGFNVQLT